MYVTNLSKIAEQHAVKAHDYKAPEFFGIIKLDTIKYGVCEVGGTRIRF
jgi:hypothetical protein